MSQCGADGHERKLSATLKSASASGAGAVDEESFRQSFIPSTSLSAYSSKELVDIIERIKQHLSGNPEQWKKRVDALSSLRSLVANGASQFDEFPSLLKSLETPVDGCLRDLRSAVVREACVTVAFLSTELRNRFDHFAEGILQTLIMIMSNSAKIISSSGVVATRFILENTHSPRLFPILVSGLTSKSSITRRCICEFLEIIFRAWPVNVLEKQLGMIQDSLKRGISDADSDARAYSRRAFPLFAAKFPDQANLLFQSLDAQKRKMLEKDMPGMGDSTVGSRSNSQTNLNTANRPPSANTATVTRRPARPALGTSGIAAAAANNGLRSRPPLTNQNDYNTVGRFVRQGSISSTFDFKARGTGRKMVSQSQPTSREVSPSRIYNVNGPAPNAAATAAGYTPQQNPSNATPRGAIGQRNMPANTSFRGQPARIPAGHSQNHSRDASPARSVGGYSASAYQCHPAGINNGSAYRYRPRPSISAASDNGDYGDSMSYSAAAPRGQFESDDNFSETSSQCSERSGRSAFGYRRQLSVNITSNLKEIFGQLCSAQWSDKKDGLINLQSYLSSDNPLGPEDIQRLTEIFSKMFADSQGKVVSLFMETLRFFIKKYNPLLRDWLYILLIRLFQRQGHEVLGSHQKAIQETLVVLRSHFPLGLQFATCCRFVVDNTQTPNSKVKVCLLEYMKDLILAMNPDVIAAPTAEISSAIARIISWSTEPKSADVRRMASRIVIKLYDLNTVSFRDILQSMPRNIQDRASDLLKAYEQKTSSGGHSPSTWNTALTNTASLRKRSLPLTSSRSYLMTRSAHQETSAQAYNQAVSPSYDASASGRVSPEYMKAAIRQTTEGLQSLTTNIAPAGHAERAMSNPPLPTGVDLVYQHQNSAPLSGQPPTAFGGVLRSVQPVTNNGQAFQSHPKLTSSFGGVTPPFYAAVPSADTAGNGVSNQLTSNDKTNLQPRFERGDGLKVKNPMIGYHTLRKIREMPPEDIMSEILQELSNHNERHEQRKACMLKLMKLLRDGLIQHWDEYFKPTLLILLETLGDCGSETRALSLKVLQELVRSKPDLFHDFAHLFVIKVLEACVDADKAVSRAAEDCSHAVAQSLPAELCLHVLPPLISDEQALISLPAVKMQTRVIRHATPQLVNAMVGMIAPGLIAACSHEDSAMRKAGIFCLVAMYVKMGDALWTHIAEMTESKKRLLRFYIDREGTTMSSESIGARS